MEDFYSREEIASGLPAGCRNIWHIECAPIPRAMTVVEALWEAAAIVAKVMRIPERMHIVLGSSPFRIRTANHEVQFTSTPTILSSCFERVVLIDTGRIQNLKFAMQVGVILEQLVHVALNLKDEVVVSYVLGLLYRAIEYRDGKLGLAEMNDSSSPPHDPTS